MILKKRHKAAINKLRMKLFGKTLAADYGIDFDSEQIIEPNDRMPVGVEPTLGGLGYHLSSKPDYRVEITHLGGDQFRVFFFYSFPTKSGTRIEQSSYHFQTPFRDLDWRLKAFIDKLE